MYIKIIAASLLLAAATTTSPAHAQNTAPASASENKLSDADVQALRQSLRSDKKQLTAEILTLTDTEATRFWPVYDRYIGELTVLNNSKYSMLQEYIDKFGKFDDKSASALTKRMADYDIKAAQLRAKYDPEVGKVLPGVKAATFFQLDRRIDTLIDLQMSSRLPIMQLQSQVAK